MVAGGTTENKKELDFGFLIVAAPVKVAVRVSSVVRSRGSAVNHIPESSITED